MGSALCFDLFQRLKHIIGSYNLIVESYLYTSYKLRCSNWWQFHILFILIINYLTVTFCRIFFELKKILLKIIYRKIYIINFNQADWRMKIY